MALTLKKRAFIENYLRLWQGDKAAVAAGYSVKTARKIANNLLREARVKSAIEARLAELKMGADEILTRLSEQGRANPGDFFAEDGEPDWEHIRSHGHLIKSISQTRYGWRIEVYDGQNALIQMGRAAGLFTERHVISGELAVKLYANVSPDDWDSQAEHDEAPLPGGTGPTGRLA